VKSSAYTPDRYFHLKHNSGETSSCPLYVLELVLRYFEIHYIYIQFGVLLDGIANVQILGSKENTTAEGDIPKSLELSFTLKVYFRVVSGDKRNLAHVLVLIDFITPK
jgi:hypothetical protein